MHHLGGWVLLALITGNTSTWYFRDEYFLSSLLGWYVCFGCPKFIVELFSSDALKVSS